MLGSKAVERNVVLEMVKTVQTPPPGKRQREPGSSQKATSSRPLVGEVKKPRSSNTGKATLHTLVKLGIISQTEAKDIGEEREEPQDDPQDETAAGKNKTPHKPKGRLESIGKKREVIRFYEQLPDYERSEQRVLTQFKGIALSQGKLAIWRERYHAEKHELIPDHLAWKWKLVPEWWHMINNIKHKKRGRDPNWWCPQSAQAALDPFLQHRIRGPSVKMS